MTEDKKKLIICRGLSVGYDGGAVVENLNFSVDEGDYLCIVGENGSGKTTLMRTLLGLQQPVSGEIILESGLRSSGIGYLPQQMNLQKDFPASVREIVLSGCQGKKGFRPFYNSEDKARADESMKKMDIQDIADRCYRELSGGQQQRVLLARALTAAGEVLLLDEPVSGLDPRVTAEMYDLIEKLNREGTAIIMISHDIAAAVRYAKHILHIGSEVFFGTRDEYAESETGRFFISREKENA